MNFLNFVKSDTFKKYFVPGIVFQSVVIAGGYGTGAELVEFFLKNGTIGGLVAMLMISMVIWSVVCAATFEFARVFKAFDYRTFFKKLLGKFWWLYEVCYLVLLLIVLAVIASSAGTILNELFGLNYYVGVVGMMAGVGVLVIRGTDTIEKFLSYWSFLLYALYITFLVATFSKFGTNISEALATGTMESGWVLGGLKYAFYNLGIIPAVLFTARHLETRKEAVTAGILAGVIGIVPGVLLLIAMIGFYPDILTAAVPTVHILNAINSPLLQYTFQIILFGTLIETGTGFIFAVTERLSGTYKERNKVLSPKVTLGLTILLLALGVFIAQFGLLGLIAKGYGTITWGFFLFYVVPVVTIGVYMIKKNDKQLSNNK
ncbi:MAG: YkvI family membrane protein [Bacillota bacterium]